MLETTNKLPPKLKILDSSLRDLANQASFEQAQCVVNNVIALLGGSDDNVWKLFNDSNGRIRSHAGWFMLAKGFSDKRSTHTIVDNNIKNIDLKCFWMQKKKVNKSIISWLVALTPNFEDEPFYGKLNIGIDFVISEKADKVFVILSQNYVIRIVELKDFLSITQQEIFNQWLEDLDCTNKAQVHKILWESFDFEVLNRSFYKEVSAFFIELKQYLVEDVKIFDGKQASYFTNRLIGRIVFCWFLDKKGIINPHMEYFKIGKKQAKDYYSDKLETLFFKVLNTPFEDREEGIDDKTPFLNGGLFERKDNDKVGDDTLNFPKDYFDRLFNFLRHYNFTTDESTSTFQQVAIDPEMLGRIFENLLAEQVEETGEQARKAKGAFYTPREIVDYMCRESLREHLKTHIPEDDRRDECIASLLDEKPNSFRDQQQNRRHDLKPYKYNILKILDEMKILDPACGSGAYPIGIMHIVLDVYERLDPTFDIYKKKTNIIKNNLFGVDIEPMAVEICRLRAWLSIIVDEEVDSKKIEPLPNLDFKFICANSLIPLRDEMDSKNLFDQIDSKKIIEIRDKYFNARTSESKNTLRKQYEKLIDYKNIVSTGASDRERQLKTYHPFNVESVSEFFDADLMFGVSEGFDIVIGNPPYVRHELIKDLKPKLKQYTVFTGTADIYTYFYERGVRLLNQTGYLCYITSNKWMRAKYGEKLRKFFKTGSQLKQIIDFGGKQIFESATVDTNILLCGKADTGKSFQYGKKLPDKDNELSSMLISDLKDNIYGLFPPKILQLKKKIEKMGTPLKDWDIKIKYGIKTGYNKAFIIDTAKRDELIQKDPKSEEIIKPILRGRDIKAYEAKWAGLWLINSHNGDKNNTRINIDNYPAIKKHLDQYYSELEKRYDKGVTPYNLRNCAYLSEFEKEKIVYSEIVQSPQFYFDDKKYYVEATSFIITGDDIKFLIGLLHSSLITYVFKTFYAGGGLGEKGYRYKKIFLEQLPIPKITSIKQKPFINLVDKIIEAKKGGEDTKKLELEIDQMVYNLYNLTEEEIKIVDKK